MSLPLLSPDCRCFITGSTDPGSIGYGCAVAILQAGAGSVTLSGRDSLKLDSAVHLLKESASTTKKVFGVVADLKESDQMLTAIEQAASHMGGLDVLVISGANGGSEYLGLSTTDPESFRLLHTISVISPMVLTHAAVQAGATSIVMVTSMASNVAWPDTAPYNTAKAAQNCLVEQLAFQYRNHNVRINAVLPACIHSVKLDVMAHKKGISVEDYAALRAEASPIGRNGTVEEVARAVVFLSSSNYSSFITGTLLPVDGGLRLSNWWNKPHMLAEYKGL
jgi:NAD(P)-dependent dehydrogenase (short-subunit alcohol dehydrogenase family)